MVRDARRFLPNLAIPVLMLCDIMNRTLGPLSSVTLEKQAHAVSLHGEEVAKRFGGLNIVDTTLIPVGMVQLFKTSRMKLDE